MRESENIFKSEAMQYPGLCGRDMLVVLDKVINKIIVMEDLGEKISIGVGVTFGSVIVTKIGIESFYDVKAFGDCINLASKGVHSITFPPQESPQSSPNDNDAQGLMLMLICED